jgi:hypothetical protein
MNTFDVIREVQKCVKRGEPVACEANAVQRSFTFFTLTECWEITLFQIKEDFAYTSTSFEEKVKALFRTVAGRQHLCTEVLEDL